VPARKERFPVWFAGISRAFSQHMLDYVDANFGLNLAEYRVLDVLRELKSTSIRDIASECALDKAQVTRAVSVLTARGLVVQVVDRNDRRLRIVRLTPAGRALIAATVPFVVQRQKRLEQCLSATERRILWKALKAILNEIQCIAAEDAQADARLHRKPSR